MPDRAPASSRLNVGRLLALAALLVAAYFPALRGGLLWDDERHVTAPALRSAAGLAAIWTDIGATQQYYPVLHSAFWLQHRLWGDATPGYHLTNLALHALAAALFALVLHRLAIPGAWLAAALFALHPVHVESVAWISEQKNTLSAVFALAATLGFLRFDRTRRGRDYALASLCFVLGLLTKSVVAMLPVALLVVAWWRHRTLSWSRDVCPLMPWLVVGAAAGLFTAWLERTLIGAEGEAFALTALQRALLAPHTIWFYLGKLLWPAQLTFIYPRWDIRPETVAAWLPLLCLAAALGVLWLRRARTVGVVVALYVVCLFPVLGFLNVFPFLYSFVADHFQYFASLPVIALAAAGLDRLGNIGRVPALLLVLGLGILTWRQAGMYRDIETLYRTTIARNPACWMAHNNFGKELLAQPARLPEATAHFQRALALRPAYAEAHTNLGLALTYAGRPDDAVAHHRESLRLKPGVFQTHNNLGIALARSGRAEEALAAFARAAELNPRLPNIHENWAKALLLLGRADEAAARQAVAARLRNP
jgi:tetratricopeptide (TPR) repeat protein